MGVRSGRWIYGTRVAGERPYGWPRPLRKSRDQRLDLGNGRDGALAFVYPVVARGPVQSALPPRQLAPKNPREVVRLLIGEFHVHAARPFTKSTLASNTARANPRGVTDRRSARSSDGASRCIFDP